MRSRKMLAVLLLAALWMMTLTGISGDLPQNASAATPEATLAATPERDSTTSYVKIVHAVPDMPAVDFYLDGKRVATGLAFGDVSELLEMPSKPYELMIRKAGDKPDAEPIYGVKDATLAGPGQSVALVALGYLERGDAQRFRVRLYGINRAPTEGKARLQAIHASPDSPAIDVRHDQKNLARGLVYPNGLTKPILLDAGVYNLKIYPFGGKIAVWGNFPGIRLEAETVNVVMLIGPLGKTKGLAFSIPTLKPVQ